MTAPAETIRRAAKLMRERAQAVPQDYWPGRPWEVTECSEHDGGCPCIIYQGIYAPLDEPQGPPIQYVADAEDPETAAFIASMHPAVALAVADWLDEEAADYDGLDDSTAAFRAGDRGGDPDPALKVARLYLGEDT